LFQQPPKASATLASVLTPDPSSSLAKDLVLHGRALYIVPAVSKEEISKLNEERARKTEKVSGRNLHLLEEGGKPLLF
jgi:nucleolar protein 4